MADAGVMRGVVLRALGASWGALGSSWAALGSLWEYFGSHFGRFGAIFWGSEAGLGAEKTQK